MNLFLRKDVPTARNEGQADCMRAAMLSVVRTFDPETPMTVDDLRKIASFRDGEGTDFALASIAFNLMGLQAGALATTKSRIPADSLRVADSLKLPVTTGYVSPSTLRAWMKKGHMIICGVNPHYLYKGAEEGSHAVTMTGYTNKKYIYHENMWSSAETPDGKPHARCPENIFEQARFTHDGHTIVVFGPSDKFKRLSRFLVQEVRTNPAFLRNRFQEILKKAPEPKPNA